MPLEDISVIDPFCVCLFRSGSEVTAGIFSLRRDWLWAVRFRLCFVGVTTDLVRGRV